MVAVGRLHISDKMQHFGAYLVLSFLPVLAVQDLRRGTAIGLSMIVLGGLLELGQTFSPGRSPEIRNEIVNTLGVVCGVLLARGCRYGSRAWRKREAA
jgi:VanZ family protein